LAISSTTFSLISRELVRVASSKVVAATYLGRLFIRSAKPCSSVMDGQAAATPWEVTSPRSSASLANSSSSLNVIASSLQNGKDQSPGS
jgi:hypothetical protein